VLAVALLGAGASEAAAPVKPKNGLYQGATAQYRAIGFQVTGRDTVDRIYVGLKAGSCDTFIGGTVTDPQPISNRGRFSVVKDFGGSTYTMRGRFYDKTKARGRLIYVAGDPSECDTSGTTVRFRVKRTPDA
jgi:hypothetical protein